MKKICPLCNSTNTYLYHFAEDREYHHCKVCDLVFVPKEFFVSVIDEKAKYDNHKNTPTNKGYCDFLNRLLIPLQKYLDSDAKGLDFGSGPGPTLSVLMNQRGFKMDIYDIFYHDKKEVFENKYDFITTTEVIEHLHNPLNEIKKLWSCLKDGGVLGIMTAFRPDEFKGWYYKRDLTHIIFFTPTTFEWLANFLEATFEIPDSGVVILKKLKSPQN